MNKSRHPFDHKHCAAATCGAAFAAGVSNSSIDRRIRAFLNGESHGEDVLGGLYGKVANEAVPERLVALLRR